MLPDILLYIFYIYLHLFVKICFDLDHKYINLFCMFGLLVFSINISAADILDYFFYQLINLNILNAVVFSIY